MAVGIIEVKVLLSIKLANVHSNECFDSRVAFTSSVKYLVVHIIVPEQVCDNVISSFYLLRNETSRYRV